MFRINVRGCRLNIHFSLFALIAFCNLVSGVKNGIWMLAVILLHESAHLAAMVITRNLPDGIQLSALGMRITLPRGKQISYGHNIFISLAGPASNFIGGFLCMLFGLHEVGYMNFALGIFHALPIEPLDGGLAMHALLSAFVNEERAEKVTLLISLMFILPIMILGFLVLLHTRYNFTLLAVSLYLMLYLVLKKSRFL